MKTILLGALLGYCSTTVSSQKVCSPIVAINPQDHLIDRCPQWAKSISGQGWGYVNSYDRSDLEEKQKTRCQRFEDIDRGDSYACRIKTACAGDEVISETGQTIKALSKETAVERCVNVASEQYLNALKNAALQDCSLSPLIERF